MDGTVHPVALLFSLSEARRAPKVRKASDNIGFTSTRRQRYDASRSVSRDICINGLDRDLYIYIDDLDRDICIDNRGPSSSHVSSKAKDLKQPDHSRAQSKIPAQVSWAFLGGTSNDPTPSSSLPLII